MIPFFIICILTNISNLDLNKEYGRDEISQIFIVKIFFFFPIIYYTHEIFSNSKLMGEVFLFECMHESLIHI